MVTTADQISRTSDPVVIAIGVIVIALATWWVARRIRARRRSDGKEAGDRAA